MCLINTLRCMVHACRKKNIIKWTKHETYASTIFYMHSTVWLNMSVAMYSPSLECIFSSYYFRFSSLQFSPQVCCCFLCSANSFPPQLSTKSPRHMGLIIHIHWKDGFRNWWLYIVIYKGLLRIGPFYMC